MTKKSNRNLILAGAGVAALLGGAYLFSRTQPAHGYLFSKTSSAGSGATALPLPRVLSVHPMAQATNTLTVYLTGIPGENYNFSAYTNDNPSPQVLVQNEVFTLSPAGTINFTVPIPAPSTIIATVTEQRTSRKLTRTIPVGLTDNPETYIEFATTRQTDH